MIAANAPRMQSVSRVRRLEAVLSLDLGKDLFELVIGQVPVAAKLLGALIDECTVCR